MASAGQFDLAIKLVLAGDTCVGKTCLLRKYLNDIFEVHEESASIGVDFRTKVLNIAGKRVRLQIWDTAGQERFRSVTTAYMRHAAGVVLAFDVCNVRSFTSLPRWRKDIATHTDEAPCVLVGNKCDAADEERMVTTSEAVELAKAWDVPYVETSAKTGTGVDDVFAHITKAAVEAATRAPIARPASIARPHLSPAVPVPTCEALSASAPSALDCCRIS